MSVENILIKVTAETQQAVGQLQALRKVMKAIRQDSIRAVNDISTAVKKNFSGMRAIPKALMQTGQIPNINAELKALGQTTLKVGKASEFMQGAMQGAIKTFDKQIAFKKQQEAAQKAINKQLAKNNKLVQKQIANTPKLAKKLSNVKREFAGWAMSMMFAGMAIKRFFDTIWKTSTKTFQDISHSVEGTVTQFDMLDGSMKFLQYVAGQALEPLAEAIMPIISFITDWINEHEKLFRIIVATGIVFGTLTMNLGMGKLAWDGFAVAGGKAMVILSKIGGLSPAIVIIAAALVAIGAIAWTAFSKTPKAWKAMKDAFKEIDLDPIKEALLLLIQQIFPDFKGSWEDIAWLFAWVGKVIALSIQIIIEAISFAVNAVGALIEAIKQLAAAWWAWISGDWGAIDDALKNYEEGVKRSEAAVRNIKSLWSSSKDYAHILSITPNEFKAETEAKGKLAEVINNNYITQPQFIINQDTNLDDLWASLSEDSNSTIDYSFGQGG